MKKALVVLLALACVAGLAFADGATAKWSISSLYGLGVYSPSSGNQLVQWDYSRVGNDRTRLGFTYTSADGNAGFNSRLAMANTTTAAFDQLNGWGKFFGGMLTVRAGVLDDYTIATTDWDGFGNTDGALGIYFNISPMAGLDIGVFQPIPAAVTPFDNFLGPAGGNYALAGLAFSMPNLVAVQAGVKADKSVWFGANLKAVPNLTAILEASISLATGNPMTFVENVAYAMGPLTVGARFGEYSNSGLDWGVEPTVSYKVNDTITVNAIVNVYDLGEATGGSIHNLAFFGPQDAYGSVWTIGLGDPKTVNFGGGVSANVMMSGATLTIGDYYSAANLAGNLFYVNMDVSL